MAEIRCPLNLAAEKHRDATALISGDRSISYGEYNRSVDAVAEQLRSDGLKTGQSVVIISDNCIEMIVSIFGIIRAGGTLCPISVRYPVEQIRIIVGHLKPRLLLTDREALVEASLPVSTRALPTVLSKKASSVSAEKLKIDLDKRVSMILTSGTTSKPKTIIHTYGNHYYNALGSNENIALQPGDRWLVSLPLYHIGGMAILFRAILAGAAVVVATPGKNIADTIKKHQITHLSLVPTQLRRLVNIGLDNNDLARLKAILVGGDRISHSLIKESHRLSYPIVTTYGLSEMSSQVTATAPGDPLEKWATSGKVLSHREIQLAPDGEIMVRGACLFAGYRSSGGESHATDNEGWFATGDLGKLDNDDYLTITGRRDNMFISGGENIQPEEIEKVLMDLPGIADAVVVPVPDNEFGQRPVAIVKSTDSTLTDSDIVDQLQEKLPRYKIPIKFLPWDEVKCGSRVKPDRSALAQYARTLLDQCD